MSVNRYDIEEMTRSMDTIRVERELIDGDLGALFEEVRLVSAKPRELHSPAELATPIHLKLIDSTAANAGRALSDLDRELRRTSTYLLNGRLRPSRDVGSVEVLDAKRSTSIDIVVAVSKAMHTQLSSIPMKYLLTLSWLWNHRVNRTRVLKPISSLGAPSNWNDLILSGESAVLGGSTISGCDRD
jgi:hypothetical protein